MPPELKLRHSIFSTEFSFEFLIRHFSQNCERRQLSLSCPSTCLSISLSVCQSVRPHAVTQLPLNGFSWDLICEHFFENFPRILNFLLKSDKITEYFTWRPIYIMTASHWILLRMTNASYKRCTVSQNRYFISNIFFRKSCRLWVMWKNIVQPNRIRMKL